MFGISNKVNIIKQKLSSLPRRRKKIFFTIINTMMNVLLCPRGLVKVLAKNKLRLA
jgi:hypothetical protein